MQKALVHISIKNQQPGGFHLQLSKIFSSLRNTFGRVLQKKEIMPLGLLLHPNADALNDNSHRHCSLMSPGSQLYYITLYSTISHMAFSVFDCLLTPRKLFQVSKCQENINVYTVEKSIMIRSWFKIGVRGILSVQCFTRKKGQLPHSCSSLSNKPEHTTAGFLWKINFQAELKCTECKMCPRHPVSYLMIAHTGWSVWRASVFLPFLQVVCNHGNPAVCCAVPVQV